jgi:DNA-binding HxlR family transcriptional regulator
MKRYGQHCPLARALDVIGERWNPLIVRELSLGPRRYNDLLAGLPGIPTNLLATRLRDLTDAGVIERRTLPRPASVTVYSLTEAGQALRPALQALREWGRRYGPAPSPDDTARPGWALLSATSRPTGLPPGVTCELRVDDEPFTLGATDAGLTVAGGPAPDPSAVVSLTAADLFALMSARATPAATTKQATITGDRRIARTTLTTLHGALSAQ